MPKQSSMPSLPPLYVCCALRSAGRAVLCLAALREALAGSVGTLPLAGLFYQASEKLEKHIAPQLAAVPTVQCLPLMAGEHWHAAVSALAGQLAAHNTGAYILLLDEDVCLAPGSLLAMQQRLACGDVCGVTPQLLTPPFISGVQRVLHMGTVADARQQLYHLYEGIPAGHPLTRTNRTFQTAPDVALLLRLQDFAAVKGFTCGLDELTGMDLGLRIAGHTGQSFACEAGAQATWHDLDASWRICGLWNSLAQRGRFAPGTTRADYAAQLRADGISPGINEWLSICPQVDMPAPQEAFEAAWLASRPHNPVAMLQYLQGQTQESLPETLALCRSLPGLHPHTFVWYAARAKSILAWAEEEHFPALGEQLVQWQKRTRRFHHGLLKPTMQALVKSGFYNVSLDSLPAQYDAWLELEEPQQRADIGRMDVGRTWPEIAVIVPVYNPEPRFLREALDSVLAQRYSRWQLCVADDASTNPEIAPLLREYAAREPRMRLVFREQNGHISRASNTALELADAPFAAFFDHDDLLHSDALARVAQHLADNPATRFVYTDEDKVDTNGIRRTPIFKPAFDMDLHYTWHLSTYAMADLRDVGGLRAGLEGSQDFDLSLRITELLNPDEIAHIPAVLYHWRIHVGSTTSQLGAKPYVLEATQKALRDSLQRRDLHGEVCPAGKNNFYRPLLTLHERPKVQLVILGTQHTPVHATTQAQLDALAASVPVQFCQLEYGQWTHLPPSDAQITVFLDASLVPGPDCHLEQLVAHALRPEVGIACGELWVAGHLHNGGWYPDVTGTPFTPMRGATWEELKYGGFGQFLCNRRVLAPAWQCVAVKTADFAALNGLDSRYGQWAWVDYALRAEAVGMGHTLLTPWAQWQLTQPEKRDADPADLTRLRERWGDVITSHGTRNPLLCASPDHGWALKFH